MGFRKAIKRVSYVNDLADAIKFIINNNVRDELINIGSGEEITIKDLANLICEVIGYNGSLLFDSSMPDGNPRKLLDSSKINSLGWKAKTKLKNGLEKTYKWYVENFS
ncbi:hypothetical protein CM15mP35_02440 [bacterium]|nr:MAG: hypothetical protein CM15mP35_02440 [bacterium]